jgi:GAF domain-containing protein
MSEAALRISAQAMSSLDVDDTITAVMDGLAYIAVTDSGALFLLEDDQWVCKAGYGIYGGDLVNEMRYPFDELASAVSAVESKRVVVSDDGADISFRKGRGPDAATQSCMIVPLVTGNRFVGVVYLCESDEKRSFSEEQMKFATIIGSHAALALDNAIIFQNELTMRKSLEAIELISEAGLVSLNLDEVLMELVGRTQDVMQMDAAMILLYDEKENCLVGRAATGRVSGTQISETRLSIGEGLAGRAFEEATPMKIDNVRGHEEEVCPVDNCPSCGSCGFSDGSGIVSVLAVPLRIAGKMIGVLQVGSRHEAAFSAREWGLIQVLADRASLALHNSMLHEKTKNELARVGLLRDVAAACAETGDIRAIAERALKCIYDRLGCSIASVFLLDRERNALVNLAFFGHTDAIMEQYRVRPLDSDGLLVRSVLERRVITHEDLTLKQATQGEADILLKLGVGNNRRVTLPIIHENDVVGGMALVFPDSRPFGPAALDTITGVANQLAVAMKSSLIPIDILDD